jgi:hypothetical protein
MRLHHCRTASFLLGIVGSAAAQGQVVPAALTVVPAGSFTTWPFGVSGAVRMQTLYHTSEMAFTAPLGVTSLEVRADELRVQPLKPGIQLQIEMGTTPATGSTLLPDFALNRGANHTVVFARRAVSLPLSAFGFPGPFLAPFLLDAPFQFDPQAGNLLVEYDISAQPAGTVYLDTPASFASGAHRTFGVGCAGLYAPTSGAGLGHNLAINLYGGLPNGAALHVLGFAELPVPLQIPGSPGCFGFISLDLFTSATIDQNGFGLVIYPVPADPALRGASIYSQFLTLSVAFGISASNGSQVVFGDRHQVHRVHSIGSNTAPQGFVQNHVAPVVRLR